MVRKSLHPVNILPSKNPLRLGFADKLWPLHQKFTSWQLKLLGDRRTRLLDAHEGLKFPDYDRTPQPMLPPGMPPPWKIRLPDYLLDQRNQITGPADSAGMVVGMSNSGSPGRMLDLEDSMVNTWEHSEPAFNNIVGGLYGSLTFVKEDGKTVAIDPAKTENTVAFVRVRGLHMSQWGVYGDSVAAALFDTAMLVDRLDLDRLPHRTLHIYIPKSESAAEGLWWAAMFKDVCRAWGWPDDAIKCMALVESHPLAYEMDQFIYALRDHIVGLNLGRWDYMASLGHFMMTNPDWVLPDRDAIPHDVPFFQNLRRMMVETCHYRGILAIGGMTALFPDKEAAELDAGALEALARDKKNEADVGMDGAWTGHPKQNAVAVAQFPVPNQLHVPRPAGRLLPLRELPKDLPVSADGTRAALRTAILYRVGVLKGRGASLIRGSDGKNRMEDLATDRICRVLVGQRIALGIHTEYDVVKMLDEEKAKLSGVLQGENLLWEYKLLCKAALITLEMIILKDFDPA